MRKSKGLILCLLVSLALAGCSSGDVPEQAEETPTGPPIAFEECVTEARRIDAAGRLQWHDERYDYIVEQAERFEGLAAVRREYQKEILDLEQARFDYLLQNAPERIVFDRGLTLFRNQPWTEEDSAALAVIDPEFSPLEKNVAELKDSNREHPQTGVFAEFLNVTLAKAKSYEKVVEAWQANDEEVTALLNRCLPYEAAPAGE